MTSHEPSWSWRGQFQPRLLSAFGSSFHALCSVGSTLWPLPPSSPHSPRAGLSSSPVLPALPWFLRQWAPGQVPRALLTWSSSFSHPFPSSFPAFTPFLKPPYVFCTEQPGLLLQRRQDSSGSNMLSTALLPKPVRAPLCPTPPASRPALWTLCFSCLLPSAQECMAPGGLKKELCPHRESSMVLRRLIPQGGAASSSPLEQRTPTWRGPLAPPAGHSPSCAPSLQPSALRSCRPLFWAQALVLAPWGCLLAHRGWRRLHSSRS